MSKKLIATIFVIPGLLLTSSQAIAAPATTAKKSAQLSPQLKYVDQLISSIKPKVLASDYENVDVMVDPILKNSGWAKDSISNLTTSLKLLRYLGYSSPVPIHAYISWGPAFKNQYVPVSCQYNSGGGSCGNGILFADVKWFTDMWGFKDKTKSKYPDASTKVDVSANLPHEIGHVLQESASSGTESQGKNLQPAWLREGSAEFFKLATYSIQNNIPYSTLRNQALKYWKYCKGVKLESLAGQGSYKSSCEYVHGLVAIEYLLWKKKSLEILTMYQKTSGTSQSEIFLNAFGLNQSSFQKEADKYFVAVTAIIPSN